MTPRSHDASAEDTANANALSERTGTGGDAARLVSSTPPAGSQARVLCCHLWTEPGLSGRSTKNKILLESVESTRVCVRTIRLHADNQMTLHSVRCLTLLGPRKSDERSRTKAARACQIPAR